MQEPTPMTSNAIVYHFGSKYTPMAFRLRAISLNVLNVAADVNEHSESLRTAKSVFRARSHRRSVV